MCQSQTQCNLKGKGIKVLEEIANCVTHGICIPSSLYLLYKFCVLAKREEDLVNAWIYGISLIVLFSVSTLYHCSCFTDYKYSDIHATKVTEHLRISDHATIYFFIAASYTPWLTIAGYDLVTTHWVVPIWSIATFGIFFSFYTGAKSHIGVELIVYVVEGVIPAVCLIMQVGYRPEHYELAMGGFFYLSGIVFFKLDGKLPFAHAIWHLFVFMGSYYHSIALIDRLNINGGMSLHHGL